MAISFDASSKGTNFGSTNTGTVSHTTSVGADRLMVVVIHTAANENTVTSITYNGVNFTTAGQGFIGGVSNGGRRTEFWYLLDPASGAHDVVVTVDAGTLVAWSFSTATYTGVNQTDAIDVTGTAVAGDPMRVTLITTVDNTWLIGGACVNGTFAVGANTTLRGTVNNSLEEFAIIDTNAAQTPPGSFSFGTTGGDANSGGMIGAAIIPAGAAAAGLSNERRY